MAITDTSTVDVTRFFSDPRQISNQTFQEVATQNGADLDNNFLVNPDLLPEKFDSAYLLNRDETEADSFTLVNDGDITVIGFDGSTTQVNNVGNGQFTVAGTDRTLETINTEEASELTGLTLNNDGTVIPPEPPTENLQSATTNYAATKKPELKVLNGEANSHSGFSRTGGHASIFEGQTLAPAA